MTTTRKLKIWTDGASKGNPGIGGWGAYMRFGPHTKELFGGAPNVTNNQMELTAVIQALSILKRPCELALYTDSSYVMKGMSEWIPQWKRNGWRTSQKKPVKNVRLWMRLDRLAQIHDIEWHWVKGHNGDPGNEKADQLANQGCDSVKQSL